MEGKIAIRGLKSCETSIFSRGTATCIALACVIAAAFLPDKASCEEPGGKNRLTELIEALESPNVPPVDLPRDPRIKVKIPKTYRHEAQDRVYEAQDEVMSLGVAAFPRLIEHLDDRRYCVTEQSTTGIWKNRPIGDICHEMMIWQVDVASEFMRSLRGGRTPAYKNVINNLEGGIEKWYAARKDKTLADLQLEVVRWAIAIETKTPFASREEEDEVMVPLNKLRDQLEGGKPVIVKTRPVEFRW